MDHYIKLTIMMSLSTIASGAGAMDPAQEVFCQKHIVERFAQALPSAKDVYSLYHVNELLKSFFEEINHSKALNARELNCSKKCFPNDECFKEYILQSMRDFAKQHPSTWIKFDLLGNDLGRKPEFFKDLMRDIVNLGHELNTDIVELDLSANELRELPERIFAGLTNLRKLVLDYNRLKALPRNIFAGFTRLQKLYISTNLLEALPEHTFEGLTQLQELSLEQNQLTELPEHIFDGLKQLQGLYLFCNPLEVLPDYAFEGLTQLKRLGLGCDRLPVDQVFIVPRGCRYIDKIDAKGFSKSRDPGRLEPQNVNCIKSLNFKIVFVSPLPYPDGMKQALCRTNGQSTLKIDDRL